MTPAEALEQVHGYERRRDVDIMKPTPENMLEWQRAQKFVLDKSSMFADMQRRVLWANPEVDYNTVSPAANFAQVNTRCQPLMRLHQRSN